MVKAGEAANCTEVFQGTCAPAKAGAHLGSDALNTLFGRAHVLEAISSGTDCTPTTVPEIGPGLRRGTGNMLQTCLFNITALSM